MEEFAPLGPGQEEGTVSFRVYRDPAKPDYLLFVEHFADKAAYDAHTGSSAYQKLIARQLANLILEFVEINHELVVSLLTRRRRPRSRTARGGRTGLDALIRRCSCGKAALNTLVRATFSRLPSRQV